jgi:hypothetical protein
MATKHKSKPERAAIPALEPKPGAEKKKPDRVQEASEESFPASDPPAHGASSASGEFEPKPAAPPPSPRPTPNGPDKVDEASKGSFPASDPPGGTSHV